MEQPPRSPGDAVAVPTPCSGASGTARRVLSETYAATEASIPVARHHAAAFAAAAGMAGDRLDALRLAVSEAVTNVVRHAYRGRPGDVGLTLGACDDELWVLVSDTGCGHHVAACDPGLGLGLALIADACDHFVLTERAAGGTEAQMRFTVRGDAEPT